MWWGSVVNFSFVLCLATCRMRSNPCDTVARFCARPVLCWLAFPSAPALGSTDSAADRSALFTGFTATTAGSDFSRSCIIGYGSSPSRCGPWGQRAHRSNVRPPRFRRLPFVRDVFFDHGRASVPRIAGPHMLPSTLLTGSASAVLWLSRLNGTPHTIAVYASHPPSPATTQHSLPGARYGLPAPVSHRQDNASFPGAQAIHRRHQKESWIASSQGLLAKTSPNCRHTTCAADTHQRPAARHARDFARNVPPLKQRAWGMPGARCTRRWSNGLPGGLPSKPR